MRRISNRRYPERICKNPACGITFEPHDRRQLYCEEQCRINANNDKRHIDNNSRFSDENQTRLNNKILKSVWERLINQKQKLVEQSILEWEQFKFDSQSLMKKNSKSGRNIHWYYDFGLELIDQSRKLFEIHKKS